MHAWQRIFSVANTRRVRFSSPSQVRMQMPRLSRGFFVIGFDEVRFIFEHRGIPIDLIG